MALCDGHVASQKYIKELREKYYSKLSNGQSLDNVVFATSPQCGAEIYVHLEW